MSDVTGAWVKDQELSCRKAQITCYRVKLKLTFILD